MRTDQFIGLNERGKKLIDGAIKHVDRTLEGAFGSTTSLKTWVHTDGSILKEMVQASPWSSGPCYFYALQDEEDRWVGESLWTSDEINDSL